MPEKYRDTEGLQVKEYIKRNTSFIVNLTTDLPPGTEIEHIIYPDYAKLGFRWINWIIPATTTDGMIELDIEGRHPNGKVDELDTTFPKQSNRDVSVKEVLDATDLDVDFIKLDFLRIKVKINKTLDKNYQIQVLYSGVQLG